MYGGYNNGSKKSHIKGVKAAKQFYNDLIIFDTKEMRIKDETYLNEVNVERRAYHSGFMIDDCIYCVGGMKADETVLNEFI